MSTYTCMPLKINVPNGNEGWKLRNCPICNEECWESPQVEVVKSIYPDIKESCTKCALHKAGEE